MTVRRWKTPGCCSGPTECKLIKICLSSTKNLIDSHHLIVKCTLFEEAYLNSTVDNRNMTPSQITMSILLWVGKLDKEMWNKKEDIKHQRVDYNNLDKNYDRLRAGLVVFLIVFPTWWAKESTREKLIIQNWWQGLRQPVNSNARKMTQNLKVDEYDRSRKSGWRIMLNGIMNHILTEIDGLYIFNKRSTMFKKHKKQKIERFSDVERLIERIDEESPASGDYLYDYKLEQAKQ